MIASQIIRRKRTLGDQRVRQVSMTIGIFGRIACVTRLIVYQRQRIAIVFFASITQRRIVPAKGVIFEDISQTVAHDRIIIQRIDQCDTLIHIFFAFDRHQSRYIGNAIGVGDTVASIATLWLRFSIAIISRTQFAVALVLYVTRHHIRFIQLTRATSSYRFAFIALTDAITTAFH